MACPSLHPTNPCAYRWQQAGANASADPKQHPRACPELPRRQAVPQGPRAACRTPAPASKHGRAACNYHGRGLPRQDRAASNHHGCWLPGRGAHLELSHSGLDGSCSRSPILTRQPTPPRPHPRPPPCHHSPHPHGLPARRPGPPSLARADAATPSRCQLTSRGSRTPTPSPNPTTSPICCRPAFSGCVLRFCGGLGRGGGCGTRQPRLHQRQLRHFPQRISTPPPLARRSATASASFTRVRPVEVAQGGCRCFLRARLAAMAGGARARTTPLRPVGPAPLRLRVPVVLRHAGHRHTVHLRVHLCRHLHLGPQCQRRPAGPEQHRQGERLAPAARASRTWGESGAGCARSQAAWQPSTLSGTRARRRRLVRAPPPRQCMGVGSDNGYCGFCPYAPDPTKIDFAAEAGKTCEWRASWHAMRALWGKAQLSMPLSSRPHCMAEPLACPVSPMEQTFSWWPPLSRPSTFTTPCPSAWRCSTRSESWHGLRLPSGRVERRSRGGAAVPACAAVPLSNDMPPVPSPDTAARGARSSSRPRRQARPCPRVHRPAPRPRPHHL